ncbi:hypothetical protein EDC01DRAFT_751108 [Geopyxis carbonaria]|nr:hypothetical protein EDC01DRAFT_751108 [Geopyxis carbonaria]
MNSVNLPPASRDLTRLLRLCMHPTILHHPSVPAPYHLHDSNSSTATMATTVFANGTLHQFTLPLPFSAAATIRAHLTVHPHHLRLFLTTTSSDGSSGGLAPLGSFVYALPSATGGLPLSTPLCVREESVETATRLAKILVKKCGRPAFVGCSMSFKSAGRGGAPEEEMEGVRRVVEMVVARVKEADMAVKEKKAEEVEKEWEGEKGEKGAGGVVAAVTGAVEAGMQKLGIAEKT